MCGRYCLHSSPETLSKELGININTTLAPSHNIAPGDSILAIFINQISGEKDFSFSNWGLKTPQNLHINSRVESIDTAPRFRDAWNESRTLIPANGFYEWYQDGLRKQPYYIFPQSYDPLYFGGIICSLSEDEKAVVIITTEANSQLNHIHNRMPLLIQKEDHEVWLNGTMAKESAIENTNNILLKAHTVSSRVNKIINNDSCLVKKQDPSKDDQMRLF
tara:strand:- start:740 stop:1396 length:657 start_codon:yes stop_codon:yes gene_type:complete